MLGEIDHLGDRFLCVEKYSTQRNYSYECLERQELIVDIASLREAAKAFRVRAATYGVLSFDLEGDEQEFPRVLLVQFLGYHVTIVHLWKIRQTTKLEPLVDALQGLFDILCAKEFAVVGSDIQRDLRCLRRYFGSGSSKFQNCHDTEHIFHIARRCSRYDRSLDSWLGARNGLGWISLCEFGYNYKCFGRKKFPGTEQEWGNFDPFRKLTAAGCPMYWWEQALCTKQSE